MTIQCTNTNNHNNEYIYNNISSVLNIIVSLHIKRGKEDKYVESMYSYFINKKRLVEI